MKIITTPVAGITTSLLMLLSMQAVAVDASAMQTLYLEYCSVCHGENGDGKSHAVQGLNPPPRDFTVAGLQLTRQYMINVVRDGKPGTAMVGWGSQLDSEQVEGLVDYIRTGFMGRAEPNEDQSGKQIYATSCSVCHGEDGMGALWGKTSLNPPPVNFSQTDPVRDMPRARMIASVTHGRPGTAMTAFTTQLNPSEIEAVVDYIRDPFMLNTPRKPTAHAATAASLGPRRGSGRRTTGRV